MDTKQGKPDSLISKINSVWEVITEPEKSVTDPIQRFKARLVVTTIAILIILITLSVLVQSDLSPFVLIVLIIGYLISRTKYYAFAAFLVIINISLFVMLALFGPVALTRADILETIAWFTPSLILAGLIFNLRQMIIISIVHILFPLSLLVYYPELEFRTIFASLGYLVVVTTMIMVNMRLRNLLEMERQKEIRNRNIELEARVRDRTAELESFSYSVSHDLRAPLRHISGFSQILNESYADKFDPEGKDYLQRITSSANNMSKLIDDLLNLSRISQQEFIRSDVNLSRLVRGICEQFKSNSPDREVEFTIVEDVIGQGDEHLIRIALENLIQNAWKFTQIESHAVIEFGVIDQDDRVVYFIKDNGIGFDQEYSDKVFEPFQRLHNHDEIGGTGIGLAIVKRIIDRHLGSIWVTSEIDKGTTFYFTLG